MARARTKTILDSMDTAAVEAAFDSLTQTDLVGLIERANREYWDDNAATLPDPLYDRLVEALRALDPGAEILSSMGPSAPAGDVIDADDAITIDPADRLGAPVRHRRPMLSLDKCYTDEDLMAWAEKFEGEVLVMPKMDGIACSLRYDAAGSLVLAATRGSGSEGEDITVNMLDVDDIPNAIPVSKLPPIADGQLEVRGELYMRLSVFRKYFAADYSNPRNLTAGAAKQKERGKTRSYRLSFFAYDVDGPEFEDEREKLALLRGLGFDPEYCEFVDRDALAAAYADFGQRRPQLDFEIDGVVYRASDAAEQARMGSTGHHPRWSLAYKFQGDSGLTTLVDVEWSVSRTGKVTPVALLEPIELSGAMIGRASLHNLSLFEAMAPTRDATVEVTRRGGVIPNVERVVEHKKGAKRFAIPTACPACGGTVSRQKKRDAEFLVCDDPDNCLSARAGELEHFAKVVDLEGFGPKVIAQCIDAGFLSSPIDYFTLRVEDLETLDRLGRKSAENLVAQVQSHRTLTLATFLRALGIDHLGKQNANMLALEFGTLKKLQAATTDDLVEIKGISDAIAHALVNGLSDRADRIAGLLAHVRIQNPTKAERAAAKAPPPTDGKLGGKSFLFTGTLEHMGRKEATQKVVDNGGVAAKSVNKDLDYLVIGAGKGQKSSKEKKADKLIAGGSALKIITEDEFLAMIE
jgi:DNA ligase (NAD+)